MAPNPRTQLTGYIGIPKNRFTSQPWVALAIVRQFPAEPVTSAREIGDRLSKELLRRSPPNLLLAHGLSMFPSHKHPRISLQQSWDATRNPPFSIPEPEIWEYEMATSLPNSRCRDRRSRSQTHVADERLDDVHASH